MKPTLLLALGALLTGCVSVHHTPYVGAQQDWPTAPGAFVRTVKGIPIYDGFPAQPYQVTGQLDAVGDPSALQTQLAWHARKHQAHAVVLQRTGTQSGGAVHLPGAAITTAYGTGMAITQPMPGTSVPITHATATAWLIRWATNSFPDPAKATK